MPATRLTMRKIREVLRLKFDCRLTKRQGRDGDAHVFMRFGFGGTLSRFEHLEKHPSQAYILEKFSCFFGVL